VQQLLDAADGIAVLAEQPVDPARQIDIRRPIVTAIAGALGFSVILIPGFGTQAAERWLIALPVLAALLALTWRVRIVALPLAVVAAVILAYTVRPVPWLAIAYGRRMNQYVGTAGKPLYIGEGMNASIVVSELTSGARYFHVSGKVEATTEPFDMRLQRMLGHISALFAARSESVLVVGFGAGVTAGTFTPSNGMSRSRNVCTNCRRQISGRTGRVAVRLSVPGRDRSSPSCRSGRFWCVAAMSAE